MTDLACNLGQAACVHTLPCSIVSVTGTRLLCVHTQDQVLHCRCKNLWLLCSFTCSHGPQVLFSHSCSGCHRKPASAEVTRRSSGEKLTDLIALDAASPETAMMYSRRHRMRTLWPLIRCAGCRCPAVYGTICWEEQQRTCCLEHVVSDSVRLV